MAKKPTSKAKKVTGKRSAGRGKGAKILELLRRKDGATLGDLTKATGWQPHSVRGFRLVGKRDSSQVGCEKMRRHNDPS